MAGIESINKHAFPLAQMIPKPSPIGEPMTPCETFVSMSVPVETTKQTMVVQ